MHSPTSQNNWASFAHSISIFNHNTRNHNYQGKAHSIQIIKLETTAPCSWSLSAGYIVNHQLALQLLLIFLAQLLWHAPCQILVCECANFLYVPACRQMVIAARVIKVSENPDTSIGLSKPKPLRTLGPLTLYNLYLPL